MKTGFWIAGDAAYVNVGGLLTPRHESALIGKGQLLASRFNFCHSNHGIHVEQVFRVFVQWWRFLFKPVQHRINDILGIVCSIMRLQNFCTDSYSVSSCNQEKIIYLKMKFNRKFAVCGCRVRQFRAQKRYLIRVHEEI